MTYERRGPRCKWLSAIELTDALGDGARQNLASVKRAGAVVAYQELSIPVTYNAVVVVSVVGVDVKRRQDST